MKKILIIILSVLWCFIFFPVIFMFGWNVFMSGTLSLPVIDYITALKIWAGLVIIRASIGGFFARSVKSKYNE